MSLLATWPTVEKDEDEQTMLREERKTDKEKTQEQNTPIAREGSQGPNKREQRDSRRERGVLNEKRQAAAG